MSDPIATIRSFVTSPVNAVAFGHVTQDDALAALDSLAAALAQAEQDRDHLNGVGASLLVNLGDEQKRAESAEARLAQTHEAIRELLNSGVGFSDRALENAQALLDAAKAPA